MVAHLEYGIIAGGGKGDDALVVQDDIEVLNWIENSCWRKVSANLPVSMYGFEALVMTTCTLLTTSMMIWCSPLKHT